MWLVFQVLEDNIHCDSRNALKMNMSVTQNKVQISKNLFSTYLVPGTWHLHFEPADSFGSLRTTNMLSPLYLLKIIEKWIVEEDIFIEKSLFRKVEPY